MRSKVILGLALLAAVLSAGASTIAPQIRWITPARAVAETDEGADADLPPRLSGKIDKSEYLRLRDEHLGRLRGLEPGLALDPSLRSQAIGSMERELNRRLLAPDGASGPVWTPLGPSPLSNGQTQQFPTTAAVSGRATAVVVDPANSNKVYLGTAQGGVWRSTNGGTTWVPIFDTAQSLAIGALALAPSDPTKLYVGTGEANNSGDTYFGIGVYRIDTVDTAPVLVGPINPQITTGSGGGALTYNCFTGRGITRILVHPTDPATIFVSTAFGIGGIGVNGLSNATPPLGILGVYRSTNATSAANTVTFSKLIVNTDDSIDNFPQTGNTSITDMVLEPGNANNLLVATSGSATGAVIMRSTNALAATPTFTQRLFPGFNGLVMKLAINKVGSIVTAYVSSNEPSPTCSGVGENGRVRKSVDGGVTWGLPLAAAEGYCGGQCYYDNPIAVDPGNASIVYLGGNARGTCSDVLKRSQDGGTTFTRDDNGLHADSHGFAMSTLTVPTTVWFVNDGGVWKRQDAAAGTAWINANNAPLNTLQFQSVAVHPTDANFTLGGTQDNGTEARLSTGVWASAESGDGGFALIDRTATDTGANIKALYHTFFNLTNQLIAFARTEDGACLGTKDSWEFRGFNVGVDGTPSCDGTATAASNGIVGSDDVIFYAPMALGPGAPNTLYFGTSRLYRSADRGDTMTAVSQIISAPSPISAIGISPSNDSIRIVGLQNGLVFGTTTGGNPLTSFAFTAPANANTSTNKYISRIVIDPINANTAYLSLSYYTNPSTAGQVWKTSNFNAVTPAWTSVSTGIPNIPVNALVIDTACANHLWAGTDIGVYETTNGGTTWVPFGLGLPRVAVFDLALQSSNRILRAATHGRGMWQAVLDSGCGILNDAGQQVDPVPDGGFSDGNNVLEPGEKAFVRPSWLNVSAGVVNVSGTASNFTGPAGATYTLNDASADYGSIASGATNNCGTATGNCYEMTVSNPVTRPAIHWDAMFTETLSDGEPAVRKLHVGQSFTDVPKNHVFYPFVERIFHRGVTTGCNSGTTYCPDDNVFRLQMAVFIARSQAGSDAAIPAAGSAQGNPYNCTGGGLSQFTDVPPTDPFCRHVHYIFSTGVTTGCITTPPRQYCPGDNVSRGQMALFIARAVAGSDAAVPLTYGPDPVTGRSYSCSVGSPNLFFTDITTSDIFCRHTHFLWAKNVISGFPDGSFGPALPVSRGAMAKFLANGFNLTLYGP